MSINSEEIKVGDRVFAKVRYCPFWPAKVINIESKQFEVKFYSDRKHSFVKAEAIELYNDETRIRFNTQFRMSQSTYKDAVEEIEKELGIWIEADTTETDCNETEESAPDSCDEEKEQLHIQELMLQNEIDLKKSLHHKNPDAAIKNVKTFQSVILPELTPLMLLKYPEVVETLYFILAHDEKRKTLKKICEEVRDMVNDIYDRIQDMFGFYPRPFLETFRQTAGELQQQFGNLSQEEFFQATSFAELEAALTSK